MKRVFGFMLVCVMLFFSPMQVFAETRNTVFTIDEFVVQVDAPKTNEDCFYDRTACDTDAVIRDVVCWHESEPYFLSLKVLRRATSRLSNYPSVGIYAILFLITSSCLALYVTHQKKR